MIFESEKKKNPPHPPPPPPPLILHLFGQKPYPTYPFFLFLLKKPVSEKHVTVPVQQDV